MIALSELSSYQHPAPQAATYTQFGDAHQQHDGLYGGYHRAPSHEVPLPPPAVGTAGRDDQFVQMLMLEASFASAVRAGDMHSAALASWRFYQQNTRGAGGAAVAERTPLAGAWPDTEDEFSLLDDPTAAWAADLGTPAATPAPATVLGSSRRRGGSDLSGWQPKAGDWVVVQGVKAHLSDGELLGHHAQVLSVDGYGLVELSVPKLGVTARLHRKYVVPLHMGVAQGTTPRAQVPLATAGLGGAPAGTPPEDTPGSHHHHRHRHRHNHSHQQQHEGSGGGMLLPAGYMRPATVGQPLPSARVLLAPGKGVARSSEVPRAVRRELLALEEGVPWECVEVGWKMRRAVWQRALRNLDTAKAPDVVVPTMSAAMQELHEALLTDKTGATPATAVLARGGVWEARLQELVAGGNSCQCLQRVWEELHDAVRVWLYTQGRGHAPLHESGGAVPGLPTLASSGPHAVQPYGSVGGDHGLGKGGSWALQATPGGAVWGAPVPPTPSGGSAGAMVAVGAGSRTFDKGAFSLALRAVQAIQQGVATTDMYLALGQLAVDRVMALGREASANLRAILAAADEVSLGPALEALAGACDLPALLGVTPGELDKLNDADVVTLMLVSPAVRAELRLLRGIESEPDTEVDTGGDMTDMEVSDG